MPTPARESGTNLSVLIGTLSRAPELRTLPSGSELLALEVTVHRPDGPAESVPVSWLAPPADASSWSRGAAVLVVGRVRRRFFRAGGVTQSRTEVVASAVLPAGRKSAARRALRRAAAALEQAAS
jgi:single-strand DNA-binding protein